MRPSRDTLLIETAYTWALRSTCSRLHVGAVIHRDGRILVQGYNGAPTGMPHCHHPCTCPELGFMSFDQHDPACESIQPCHKAVHAEANAIAYAARWGVGLMDSEIVVTNQPCVNCAMLIINAGIRSVTYCEPYRLPDGVQLLMEAGVHVRRELPPAYWSDRIHE